MARLGWIGMPSCCASSSSQSRKQVPRLVQEAKKSRSVWLELLMRKKMVEIQHQNSTAKSCLKDVTYSCLVFCGIWLLSEFQVSRLLAIENPTLRPVPKVPRIFPQLHWLVPNHQRSNKKHSKTGPRRFGSEWSFQFHPKSSGFFWRCLRLFWLSALFVLGVFVGESC